MVKVQHSNNPQLLLFVAAESLGFPSSFELMQVRASFCGLAKFAAQAVLGEARNENFKTEEMFKT